MEKNKKIFIAVSFCTGLFLASSFFAGNLYAQNTAVESRSENLEPSPLATASEAVTPNSKLAIEVLEQEELSGVYNVSSDGMLAFPLLRDKININGLTYAEVAAKIGQELKKDYFYTVTVAVSQFVGEVFFGDEDKKGKLGVVYVFGRGSEQNIAIKLREDETLTVARAIVIAGGFSDFANKKKVKLLRKNFQTASTEVIVVNVKNILEKGHLEEDVVVQDGDFIVISEKFFNF